MEWRERKNSRYRLIDTPKDYLKLSTPDELESIYPCLIAQYINNQQIHEITVQNRAIAQSSSIKVMGILRNMRLSY